MAAKSKDMPTDLISAKKAAELINKIPQTIYAQINKGYITNYGDGKSVKVSRSEVLEVQEHMRYGRKPGQFVNDVENREILEHRENSHTTGLPYTLYKDPSVEPAYWLHCHEHHRQYGVEIQKTAVDLLAKPQLWCSECCDIYTRKYNTSCEDS